GRGSGRRAGATLGLPGDRRGRGVPRQPGGGGGRSVVEEEAGVAANTVLTASTRIIDVTGSAPLEWKGRGPARSGVLPGSGPKQFPAGSFGVPCALVIGTRSASTDRKTSLNQALRDFAVPV